MNAIQIGTSVRPSNGPPIWRGDKDIVMACICQIGTQAAENRLRNAIG